MKRVLTGAVGLLCLLVPVVGVGGAATQSASAAPLAHRTAGHPFWMRAKKSTGATTAASLKNQKFGGLGKNGVIDPKQLRSVQSPLSTVTAIVTVNADSVGSAKQKAEAAGLPFDESAALAAAQAANDAAAAGLRAQGFTVTQQVTRVLNAVVIRGRAKDLQAVSGLPGVTQLSLTQRIERANLNSNAATAVAKAWEAAGATGAGTTIGIIDTGIDYTHADFGGSGRAEDYLANDGSVVEPGTFPTAKVIGGYDFAGDNYPFTSDVPQPDADPLDCDGHGTHTAGTAAGLGVLADGTTYHGPYTQAAIDAQQWNVGPGVAPAASIRSYKVFGCFGFTTNDLIIAAIDRAAADHVDVISMSLGESQGGADDPVTAAVNNAAQLGVLTVAAAGNDYQIPYSTATPSTANSALSVAAVDELPAFEEPAQAVTLSGDASIESANFNFYPYPNGPVTGTVSHVADACAVGAFDGTAGQVVVAPVFFDTCVDANFGASADTAPSSAIVVVNDLIAGVNNFRFGNVPIIAISEADAAKLVDGMSVTLTPGPLTIKRTPNPDYQHTTWFTSAGFRFGDNALKPDVAAPGYQVTSAWMGSGSAGIAESGTSMATPHVAGIALLVHQTHPTWGPAAIKGAIMSTADPSAIIGHDPMTGGVGLASASRAVGSQQWFSTRNGLDNLSYGLDEFAAAGKVTRTITLNNDARNTVTYDLSTQLKPIAGVTGLVATPSPKTVRVEGRSSVTVTVTISLSDPQHLPSPAVDDRFDCSEGDDGIPPWGACPWVRGALVATPRTSSLPVLRAGIGMVPKALSSVKAAPRDDEASSTASAATRLTNSGVHSAATDVLQWLATDAVGDNPDPTTPDLRDLGVAIVDGFDQVPVFQDIDFDGDGVIDCVHCIVDVQQVPGKELRFTFADQAPFSTHWFKEYGVNFDFDRDGAADLTLVMEEHRAFAFSRDLEEFSFELNDWRLNGSLVTGQIPVGLIERTQQRMGVSGAYDVSAEAFPFELFGGLQTNVADTIAPVTFDHRHPAVNTAVGLDLAPGTSRIITNTVDTAAAKAQHTLGWLVVSNDDSAGPAAADRVRLKLEPGR